MNPPSESPQDTAATWMARRDRGLSAAEQDAYLQWLREHPANGAAIARLEKSWEKLELLRQWRPAHSPQPNPDLLAPPNRRWRNLAALSGVLAAAAVVALVAFTSWSSRPSAPAQQRSVIHPGPERMALSDGSIVELNAGAHIEVNFTAAERRVHLVKGEAHFAVAKNPARPFIVTADKFAVRAVGTAFSVSLEQEAVSVLVTEGKVRLDETSEASASAASMSREMSHLIAGQQAIVSTRFAPGTAPSLQVREVTPAEIDRSLAWQGLRLEFLDMPLRDVVAEFNRYNARKLVVADPKTADILVAGKFRADNVDAFVRLLDSTFEVTASPRGDEIVLLRRR